MDFSALPIASIPAAPLTLPAPVAAIPPAERRLLPLHQRLTLTPTISAKANYYDLANTRRAPYDLRSALIWLCLCAHDNAFWWSPRTPDHQDGEDAPPLPIALDFAAWMRYIQTWQDANFLPHEDAAIEALALRVWLGAHETATIPEPPDPADQKKTPDPALTGQNSTPGPSPAVETPPFAPASSTPCPSATSTPPYTHGSLPTASQPSAPEKTPAETPRSTPSSPPPQPDRCPYCIPGVDNCPHSAPDDTPFWVAELRGGVLGRPAYATGEVNDRDEDLHSLDIHKALKWPTEAAARDWIFLRHLPHFWVPREHMCCTPPPA